MTSKFRNLRLRCHIQILEVAKAANISSQRLYQIESANGFYQPKDPERIIQALETVITQRKAELESVELICQNERDSIFTYVEGGEKNE